MTQVIPFESAKLPAHVASMFEVSKDLITARGGYPTISIKGKVFHIVRGEERTLVTKPGEDDPAASLEVIILKANPAHSKVYYSGGYEEGADKKPDCYSNDGIAPAADAEIPQAKKCATCKHNQWGSRITDSGGKGKACSDSQRIAVAPVGMVNDPMLLRVPAGSLKALTQYGESLAKRGVPYQVVVTKVGFDYTVAHPALTFKPVGFIDDTTALQVKEVSESDQVGQIVGLIATQSLPSAQVVSDDEEEFTSNPENAPASAPVAAPAAQPEKPAKRKATVKVEEPDAAPEAIKAAEAPPPVAKPSVVVEVEGSLESEIAGVLNELNFDDD